ncbi:UDP-4-amino-4-deoxy-L-arabinose--oxoglutarate aminotransferase [Arcticibacter svalbardensis MN12-7]|uniref:UDP-4-amino-4-deoxy-L-arabinose--oxoglutarate aminotransferase n=1 Tax=Arcticibacter svalbardensis MN12-7 TaxID=1150600 RepID=R9GPQ9_9SPHI|nr:DegT/DnrJ/EryC1/StrS family aminotransferase [Arcticibacter svalbardensis]EOR93832.1 UDP-4-amino-4-deoxy-L-arabinose--oxoglutarate aminotransferase [Arcticibacter svalbardensis MN12-7]
MNIPFSPPFIDQSVIDQVVDTLHSKWITSGPKVKALETEIMNLTGSKAAVCVNSWTSGAIMMLKWFGVKEGDEVIVPAYSYCATALCVLNCGATPVMVDVLDDFTIDPKKIKKAITSKTKAILAVDIAGWPCHYDSINKLIRDPDINKLFVPESEKQAAMGRIILIADAAHSIGAIYKGVPSAQKSDIAIFSFHAVKNITTAEGGCICLNLPVIFNNKDEYNFLKIFSLNGQNRDAFAKAMGANWRYDILFKGLKINMPDICAAVGLAQIRQYPTLLLPLRKKIAMKYCRMFSMFPWFIPPALKDRNRESSYHLFPLRVKGITEAERDEIIDFLLSKGIVVNVHFIPMPMLTYFKSIGYDIEDYPNSYKQYSCEISLPIYPQLTNVEVDYIIENTIEAVQLHLEKSNLIEIAS